MSTIVITNLSSTASVNLQDLYTYLGPSKSITITRPAITLSSMPTVMAAYAAGSISLSITYDANETGSGLLLPPQSITGDDFQPVAATDLLSGTVCIRKALTAGGGGAADDVTIYAVNTLPYSKMRILLVEGYISAGNAGGRSVQIRGAAAGGGTLVGTVAAVNTGYNGMSGVTATQVLTNGASVGLFARRSDSAIAGEVLVWFRPET